MPEFTYPTPSVITTTQAPPVPPVAPVVPPVNPTDVYSGGNIAQTLNAPVAKPDLSDPFGVRSFYLDSPEIKAAKAAAQATAADINAAKAGLRTTTTALQNQNDNAMGGTGASINLIGRQVGRARDLTANELAALSDNQIANNSYLDTLTQDANAKYQIAEGQRAQIQDLIRQTGGKAGVSYTDTFESAIQKTDKYIKKQEKEVKKEAYKDSLKATALQLGIKTKGKSTEELEKSLKNYYKDEQAYNKQIKDLELRSKNIAIQTSQQALATARAAGAGTSQSNTALANASSALLNSRGGDGKANPGIYVQQRDNYLRTVKGATPADFDAQFGGMLSVNEANKLGITNKSLQDQSSVYQTQQSATETANKALQLVNNLQNSAGLNAAVGPFDSRTPTYFGDTADFEADYNSLKSLLTLDNLGIMKGPLSDSDMKVLKEASSSLTTSMSEKKFKETLAQVKSTLSKKIGNDPLGLGF